MIKHHHFIGRFEVAQPPLGGEHAYLEDWMEKLIKSQGMNILSGPHVAYVDKAGNRGLTGVAIIEPLTLPSTSGTRRLRPSYSSISTLAARSIRTRS